MRIYGLTGNIGTGKSTVARLFVEAGVPVVDADQVARDVVQPGEPALAEIAARFPGTVAGEHLDRKALAARVFSDENERVALNAILHPRIAVEVSRRMAALAQAGRKVALYEAALIVENGLQRGLDGLIVVTAPVMEQVKRLRLRDGMTDGEALARIAAQLPEEEKVKVATHVIENSGPPEGLRARVAEILRAL